MSATPPYAPPPVAPPVPSPYGPAARRVPDWAWSPGWPGSSSSCPSPGWR
ncbi:hypothetical protein ID867_19110 [Streptomyces parvulus]|nr:hypothetical protein [Streptomyces parvulus]